MKDVKILLREREIDHGGNRAYFNNCDSQIWFNGIKHYELTSEENIHVDNGFILCKKVYIFDEIFNFVNVFNKEYDSKLLEILSQIMSLWLMHKNMDNRYVYLWCKYYTYMNHTI